MTRLLAVVSLLFLVAMQLPSAALAQSQPRLAIGDPFPTLKAEFLTGRQAVLPDAARGKTALVMMGFTYDSRWVVEEWAKAFKASFGGRTDVTFFEVPVIGGMGRLAKWFIDSGMRKGTPSELHENVITVYGGADRWKAAMGFSKAAENAGYLALLDPDGRVRWLHRGGFDQAAMQELVSQIPAEGRQ